MHVIESCLKKGLGGKGTHSALNFARDVAPDLWYLHFSKEERHDPSQFSCRIEGKENYLYRKFYTLVTIGRPGSGHFSPLS
jgi:hypothetical protein